jgi:hypothetical protein
MPSGTTHSKMLHSKTIARPLESLGLPHWPIPRLHTLEVEAWLEALDPEGPHRFVIMLDPDSSPAISPTVVSPTVVSPTVVSSTIVSPTIVSPTVVSPTVVSPYREYVDLLAHMGDPTSGYATMDQAIRSILPQLPLDTVCYQNPPSFPIGGVVTRWRWNNLTIRLHLFPNMLTRQYPHDPPHWRKAGIYIQPDHGPGRIHTAKWCALDARGRPWLPTACRSLSSGEASIG